MSGIRHLMQTSCVRDQRRLGNAKFKRTFLTCFHAPFFLFAPFAGHPSSSPFLGTFSPFSPPTKVLCSVEHCQRAQRRAWRGAVLGWISPESSVRKFLPEICVKKGQIRSNNSEQFEGTTHANVGFKATRTIKFTRTSP